MPFELDGRRPALSPVISWSTRVGSSVWNDDKLARRGAGSGSPPTRWPTSSSCGLADRGDATVAEDRDSIGDLGLLEECVVSSTVVPRPRPARGSQARRRASGSKPVVGSSRKISSGSPTSPRPRSSRRVGRRRACERPPLAAQRGRRARRPHRGRAGAGSSRRAVDDPATVSLGSKPEDCRTMPIRSRNPRPLRRDRSPEPDSAAIPSAVALEDLDGRGLAGAVRAESANTSPGAPEIQPVEPASIRTPSGGP